MDDATFRAALASIEQRAADHAALQKRLHAVRDRRSGLEAQVQAARQDAARSGRVSPIARIAGLLPAYRRRARRRRFEAEHRKVTLRALQTALDRAREEESDLIRRIEALGDLPSARRQAIEARAATLQRDDPAWAERLQQVEEEARRLQRRILALDDAIVMARSAATSIQDTLDSLRNARTWNGGDITLGRMLKSSLKWSIAATARRRMQESDRRMRELSERLQTLNGRGRASALQVDWAPLCDRLESGDGSGDHEALLRAAESLSVRSGSAVRYVLHELETERNQLDRTTRRLAARRDSWVVDGAA